MTIVKSQVNISPITNPQTSFEDVDSGSFFIHDSDLYQKFSGFIENKNCIHVKTGQPCTMYRDWFVKVVNLDINIL